MSFFYFMNSFISNDFRPCLISNENRVNFLTQSIGITVSYNLTNGTFFLIFFRYMLILYSKHEATGFYKVSTYLLLLTSLGIFGNTDIYYYVGIIVNPKNTQQVIPR